MALVVPAVLPTSRKDLEARLALLLQSTELTRVQIDVVDGKLANPASWPYAHPGELKEMREAGFVLPQAGRVEYELDLMALDAVDAASDWLSLGVSRLTFHIEHAAGKGGTLAAARRRFDGGDLGTSGLVSFGLAVNTTTELSAIEPLIPYVSYLQCMGIERIGRQGERFDPRALDEIRLLRAHFPHLPLQVDGGVTLENAKQLLALGVSNLVVGSAVVGADDPLAAIAAFEALQNPFGV